MHRGRRHCYGLTSAHVDRARDELRWSQWRMDVADWVDRVGPDAAKSPTTPGRPEQPACRRPGLDAPRGWPKDPTRPHAERDFWRHLAESA